MSAERDDLRERIAEAISPFIDVYCGECHGTGESRGGHDCTICGGTGYPQQPWKQRRAAEATDAVRAVLPPSVPSEATSRKNHAPWCSSAHEGPCPAENEPMVPAALAERLAEAQTTSDGMQSALSRLAEWVQGQAAPYGVTLAALEARSWIEQWTEIRRDGALSEWHAEKERSE